MKLVTRAQSKTILSCMNSGFLGPLRRLPIQCYSFISKAFLLLMIPILSNLICSDLKKNGGTFSCTKSNIFSQKKKQNMGKHKHNFLQQTFQSISLNFSFWYVFRSKAPQFWQHYQIKSFSCTKSYKHTFPLNKVEN